MSGDPKPELFPYRPGYDPSLDSIAAAELSLQFEDDAVYVGGLCPRCRHPFTATVPLEGYGLRAIEAFVDCACIESHGRDAGTSCGARFKVAK